MNITTSIALLESNKIYQEQLVKLLNSNDSFRVNKSAQNCSELLSIIASSFVDVVIISLSFPVAKTIETVKSIRSLFGVGIKIVIANCTNQHYVIKQLQMAGADVLIDQNASSENLLNALGEINGAKNLLSRDSFFREANATVEVDPKLTPREILICQLICLGKSCPEIAEELFNSIRTVENHKANIFRKMAVGSCTQMMHKAIVWGYFVI